MKLYFREWKAEKEIARLLAIHGMMAHSGYFEYFGRFASKRGITVVAPDLRGYGKSGGERGRIGNVYDHLSDINRLATETLGWDDFFVLGHSLGSIYAIHYGWFFKSSLGLVLASPAFMLNYYPKTIMGFLDISMKFITGYDGLINTLDSWTNEQKSMPEARLVMADRGCTKEFSADYLASLFRLQISALMKMPFMSIPALFIAGRNDNVVSPVSMLAGYALYGGRKEMVFTDSDHILSSLFSLYQGRNVKRELYAKKIVGWLKREAL